MDLELSVRINQITDILQQWQDPVSAEKSEEIQDLESSPGEPNQEKTVAAETDTATASAKLDEQIKKQSDQMDQIIAQLKQLEESLTGRIQANSK